MAIGGLAVASERIRGFISVAVDELRIDSAIGFDLHM